MSMHGATAGLTDAARAAVAARLGDNPTVVVEHLTGDATKGVTNGDFLVVDEPHPQHADVVRNRVVKLGDVVVYGPVLVAVSDRLTHDKAANVLRSLAKVAGWSTRPPHLEAPPDPDVDPSRWVREQNRELVRFMAPTTQGVSREYRCECGWSTASPRAIVEHCQAPCE